MEEKTKMKIEEFKEKVKLSKEELDNLSIKTGVTQEDILKDQAAFTEAFLFMAAVNQKINLLYPNENKRQTVKIALGLVLVNDFKNLDVIKSDLRGNMGF
jgi:hypothetical protein